MIHSRRSFRLSRAARLLAALALAIPGRAAMGQGSMSTQGLGYPPGQMSTAAQSMGGAIADADPMSPINPAAIGLLTSPILLMQAEPEYRTIKAGEKSEHSSVARFPLFVGGLPVGQRWTFSVSASTLLDRTWSTAVRETQTLSSETIMGTRTEKSDGSITDVRLALAYGVRSWLKLGIGGHAYTGRDVVMTIREFDDIARFAPDSQQTTLGFGGNAVSVGAQTLWPRRFAIGASYRRGGALRAYVGDSVVARGRAPDHYGASVLYLGFTGSALGVHVSRDAWSNLAGLGTSLNVRDAWDLGVGADVTGPRFGGSEIGIRVGSRWRTLPFSVDGNAVRERSWTGGLALPMAARRVELHLGVIRATRSGTPGVQENAWTLSTGFAVRP